MEHKACISPIPQTDPSPSPEANQKNARASAPRWMPWLFGALLAFSTFALSLSWVILAYGELGQAQAACDGVFFISLASVIGYGLLEVHFLQKKAPKSDFALSFFAFFALLSALSFLLIGVCDLTYVLDAAATETRAVLLGACFRLVILHTALLLLRIGHEVTVYIRALSK